MKKITYLVAIVYFMITSCTKSHDGHDTPPASLNFEILGKDGKSVITSIHDTLVVSYTDNGTVNTFNLHVMKLYTNLPDTTSVSAKYNGYYITDNVLMSDLSSRSPNPVRSFNLSLNGKNIGTIYVDYWQYEANYPQPSSSALTFNNVQVNYDTTIGLPGSDINLLQMQ